MLFRFSLGLLAAVLAGTLAWVLAERTSGPVAQAMDLAGERWYRLTLHDRHIGYLHSTTGRDRLGGWLFETDLRFALQPGEVVRVRQRLVFDGTPPFALTSAGQWRERAGAATDTTLLTRDAGGYAWARPGTAEAGPTRAPDGWTFGLADYLAFENWLRTAEPDPGATVTLPGLDFGRLALTPKRYRILESGPGGYYLENPAPNEATRIRLDQRLRPTHMSLAGLFELNRVTRAAALAPRSALQAATYHVPVDRPLVDHTRIRRLELGVEGSLPAHRLWPGLVDASGTVLTLTGNTLSGLGRQGDELAATGDHPANDSRVRDLARTAVDGHTDPIAQLAALTRFVNRYIRYREDAPQRSVLDLLDEPVGNCNAYADLFTTLARAAGLPARTVFGLAYTDESGPAFRFHAWNEALVNDRWVTVDPTWNQLETDATHIPMPLDVASALQLLTGGGDLRFVVRAVGY
ncbi:MAG: transglutaminase domain-containing protein [Pseudomonadales bacterium]|nr:transglutaminase domain-containing protein [Pseudomonadales bacterium]